jgi:L-lactate dehydrogenase complex protein LldG
MTEKIAFLSHLASQLGRPLRTVPASRPEPVNRLPETRLTGMTAGDLLALFLIRSEQAGNRNCVTTSALLTGLVADLCREYGTPVVLADMDGSGLPDLRSILQPTHHIAVQSPSEGNKNTRNARNARTGIVYAEYGLAESGSVVLFSSPRQSRSLSLLPETTLFIVRKSALIPSVAQLAARLDSRVELGLVLPSCINIISGPSCTSDIELIKVIGVHGPANSVCVVIDDE